jgi:hypothetical protein
LHQNNNLINRFKQIPLIVHAVYFLLAATVSFIYFQKVISPFDFSSPLSIYGVASFDTFKPYQFRLLVPLIFKLLSPVSFIPVKALFLAYCCVIIYLLLIIYYFVICEYFKNTSLNFFLAPIILYPIIWNFVLLNETFLFYDFTAILLFTLGLYFVIKDNFKGLLIIFIIALFNKESAVYLIFCYLLFNYRFIFKSKIIINTIILGVIFIVYKVLLSYIFRNNPGGNFEIGLYGNIEIIKNLPVNRIYAKNVILNFGLIYVFAILLFISGRWKSFNHRNLLYINLVIIPYLLIGIYTIYFSEVRVYTEIVPLVSTLFLIYLSTFEKLQIKQKDNTFA